MFGYRLKEIREDHGLTQKDLAKKLNLSQSTIAYYESNQKLPTLENAKLIAEIFNTSLDYLLDISINRLSEDNGGYLVDYSKLLSDIGSLSLRSQIELIHFIDYLKYKDKGEK